MLRPENLRVANLGTRRIASPLPMSTVEGDGIGDFTPDDARILYEIERREGREIDIDLAFEKAGPRERIFFEPTKSKAAIVTCGGLCPGINNVIRTLYFVLTANYGVPEVLGIRYGFEGLNPETGKPPRRLSPDAVEEIHKIGGSLLGTSRGPQDVRVTVDFLEREGVNLLFCVGGDGTQRGAHCIADEVARRDAKIAVVGIPKTIDNDIKYVSQTFGFLTAVAEAQQIIGCAHNEATGARYGVGLVKLMGREAGFIAAAATIASGQVNFALVPEVPFVLEGAKGLLARLHRRLAAREHAVIVTAEGAGQDLIPDHVEQRDKSGNRKLGDIGSFLKCEIERYFKPTELDVKVKYFDPSYHIRSVPANTADSLLCENLARSAVHAALAGKTDVLIGHWNDHFIHVPLTISIGEVKRLSAESDSWATVQAMTGQDRW
jgi:6-phosphofructokinase 1